jgi:hypothetical protein
VFISHFPHFSVFLVIFQVLRYAFLILMFSVLSPYSRFYSVVSHFPRFSVFSPYSRSYSVCVSFSTFISFHAIIQVLQCVVLIFHVFSVSHHIPCPKVCVSYFPRFSVFSQYYRSYSVHFSFFMFLSTSCHNPGSKVSISHFASFSVCLPWPGPSVLFPFFMFFSISCHITGPPVFVSHFHLF